jgi:hypothetical protein
LRRTSRGIIFTLDVLLAVVSVSLVLSALFSVVFRPPPILTDDLALEELARGALAGLEDSQRLESALLGNSSIDVASYLRALPPSACSVLKVREYPDNKVVLAEKSRPCDCTSDAAQAKRSLLTVRTGLRRFIATLEVCRA